MTFFSGAEMDHMPRYMTLALLLFVNKACSRPLLGAQRWDMYSGDAMWSGKQELGFIPGGQGFLASAQWHHRAPWFCRAQPGNVTGPLTFNYPFNAAVLQKVMDEEIAYAFNAGLDFWIFNTPTRSLVPGNTSLGLGAWNLHNNLDAYLAHRGTNKPNFVTALFGFSALNYSKSLVDVMLEEVLPYMQLPHWQTVLGGRPLLPVLYPANFEINLGNQSSPAERMSLAEFVAYLRNRTMAAGMKDPYIVAEETNACFNLAQKYKAAGFDAISDYQGGYGGAMCQRGKGPSYRDATQGLLDAYVKSFDGNNASLPYVPPMPNQLYQWPRFQQAHETWAYELPQPGDIADRIKRVFDHVEARSDGLCEAQTVFMYSWNEMSEGGGLCPSYGMDAAHTPVATQLNEVAHALGAHS